MLQIWMAISPEGAKPIRRPVTEAWSDPHVAFDMVISGRRYQALLSPTALASRCVEASGDAVSLRVGKAYLPSPLGDERDENDLRIRLDCHCGELSVLTPISSPMQIFYARRSGTLYISTDPRLLYHPGMTIDEHGIYALLQFGALIPPHSFWKEIRRFIPGKRAVISGETLQIEESRADLWNAPGAMDRSPLDPERQEELVSSTLDAVLQRTCPDQRPVIFFSGGVDSGLLAARAAAMGWKDTLLANYSMGKNDPEAELAKAMARRLGLPFCQVTDDPAVWGQTLERICADYTQPLGDFSTVPAYILTRHIMERAGDRCTVYDGTGADVAFRTYPKFRGWKRVYALPRILRIGAAAAYGAGRFWAIPGSWERRMGKMRISRRIPYLLASIMTENPLCGIAYDAPDPVRRSVHETVRELVQDLFSLPGDEIQSRGLHLLHVVCGMIAQKELPPFLGSTLDIAFPFLNPRIVRIGFQQAIHWPQQRESKAVLKRLLVRQVPPEMVYRPKSGFTPPITEELRSAPLAAALREHVLGAENPLRGYLNMKVVGKMVRHAAQGRPLPHTTYNFLWTVLFTALWTRQMNGFEMRGKRIRAGTAGGLG